MESRPETLCAEIAVSSGCSAAAVRPESRATAAIVGGCPEVAVSSAPELLLLAGVVVFLLRLIRKPSVEFLGRKPVDWRTRFRVRIREEEERGVDPCLLYTSPSPRD